MTSEQLRTDDVADLVLRAAGDRRRLLEVGCGRGQVARALAAHGLDVTALDVALRDVVEAPAVSFVEADFLAYEAPPFEIVAFTSSLHHVAPLDAAIDRAAQLLVPGGLLVADDFDLDAPDAATLRWYYGRQEQLVAAGACDARHLDAPEDEPVARWRHAHHHEPALHTGAAMLAAIGGRFAIQSVERGPYLHRHIAHGLPADERGAALAAELRADEERGIGDGALRAVGLRVVAMLPARADATTAER